MRCTRLVRLCSTLAVSVLGMSLPFPVRAAETPHGAALLVAAQSAAEVAPNRYLVVYRSGSIPGDAEAQAERLGARVLQRHELFGITVVAADSSAVQRLAHDPAVQTVVADRIVHAGRMLAVAHPQPVIRAQPVTSGRRNLIPVHMPQPDLYYSQTPQGWAVKAVGGYGRGIDASAQRGAWDTTTGKGVRIAVLDSGVDETHPDIAPNLALSFSEVDQTALPSACDDGSPQDQSGHGTWVASLAAGAAGASTGAVVGVAPSATILNIKVMERLPGAGNGAAAQCEAGQASGLLSWVLKGIQDAVEQHADVITLSLGTIVDLYTGDGAGLKATFDQVTYAAAQSGAVLVAAAGNDGFDFSNTRYIEIPAQSRGVLAVIASANPDCAENLTAGASCAPGPLTVPYYSNRGAPLNALAAPGGSYPEGPDTGVSGWVRGACSSGLPGTLDGFPDAHHSLGCFGLGHQQYVQAIGTSASAPLVAGAVALVRAAHPDWDATTDIESLRNTATHTPGLPVGMVNATAAIAYRP